MGTVWWITGMSGAGKSTVARLLVDALRRHGRAVLLLDGDVLRAILGGTGGHDPQTRLELALTYGRLAREVAGQGVDAVCATISMFEQVRRWNRANIPHYREIYLKVPLDELERRDVHGIYARARRGELTNVVGVDIPLEEPVAPDLVIENCHQVSPQDALDRILQLEGLL